jgi:hypothetical protein
MLQVTIATSDALAPETALAEVITECRTKLDDKLPQAGLFFTSYLDIEYTALLQEIHSAFPGIKLVGCTTDSEIGAQGATDDSLSLLLFSSDHLEFATTIIPQLSSRASEGFRLAAEACSAQLEKEPACGLIFPDGLTTIGLPLDQFLRDGFGQTFPFFGGTAGDNYRLQQTYQFHGTEVYSDAAPVLLLAGDLEIAHSIDSGWTPIGNYVTIDQFEGNRVYTIGGQTAQEYYENYFGPYQQAFTDFPLAVYAEEDHNFVLRTPMGVDPEDGSMVFIGNFFAGAKARLTTILRDEAIEAADKVNNDTMQQMNDDADVVLTFSCAVRRHFLGSRSSEETQRLRTQGRIPFGGFYSYGEIGPFNRESLTRFHTNTYIALALRVPRS